MVRQACPLNFLHYFVPGRVLSRLPSLQALWGVSNYPYCRIGHPLADGPDVIGEPRRHRRRLLLVLMLAHFQPQGPHRPAEVVAVHREVGHCLMRLPILAETTGLPHLAPVAVAV